MYDIKTEDVMTLVAIKKCLISVIIWLSLQKN